MSGFMGWVFLVLSVPLFICGMLGNGFIGMANGGNWLRGRRISLSDFIITLLALSRIFLLWILLADISLMVLPLQKLDEGRMRKIHGLLWTFTHHLTLWLLACLSVLYCLKVSSFSHPAFLWLKWRVSRVVAWMLLGALPLACANATSLNHELGDYIAFFGAYTKGNVTENVRKSKYKLIHILGTLWDLPPLAVTLVSYFALLLSLRRHTGQMQQYGTSPRDPSTEAHERAIKIVFSFFSLFLVFFFALLLASSRYYLPESEMIKMLVIAVMMLHCAGHSFILILGNRSMKRRFVQMLRCRLAV